MNRDPSFTTGWERPASSPIRHGHGHNGARRRRRSTSLACIAPFRRWMAVARAVAVVLVFSASGAVDAGGWKPCAFNGVVIGCRDLHLADGSVRILWRDGPSMTYRLLRPGFPTSLLRDRYGGLWQREILIQGNAVFSHLANGNRIVVPLRPD